jgi:hypothetical protein
MPAFAAAAARRKGAAAVLTWTQCTAGAVARAPGGLAARVQPPTQACGMRCRPCSAGPQGSCICAGACASHGCRCYTDQRAAALGVAGRTASGAACGADGALLDLPAFELRQALSPAGTQSFRTTCAHTTKQCNVLSGGMLVCGMGVWCGLDLPLHKGCKGGCIEYAPLRTSPCVNESPLPSPALYRMLPASLPVTSAGAHPGPAAVSQVLLPPLAAVAAADAAVSP